MARINSNISALTARRNLNKAYASLSSTMERLSTGLRINHGKDDPAGLIRIRTLTQRGQRRRPGGLQHPAGQAHRRHRRRRARRGRQPAQGHPGQDPRGGQHRRRFRRRDQGQSAPDRLGDRQHHAHRQHDHVRRPQLLDGSLAYNTSGVDLDAVRDLQVHAAQFGERTAINVDVTIQTVAETGRLRFPYAGLAATAPAAT